MLWSRLLPRRSCRPLSSCGSFSTANVQGETAVLHVQRSQRLFNQLDKALQPVRMSLNSTLNIKSLHQFVVTLCYRMGFLPEIALPKWRDCQMRDCNEGIQIRRVKENEMFIELGGDNGCFSFHSSDGKVLMQSPLSGVHRYEYDQKQCWWKNDRDQHLLTELFSREIVKLCKGFPHL